MHVYRIKFQDAEGEQMEDWDGVNPGNAFAKCQKAHPGAKMLQAYRQHRLKGWQITYDPPPVQRDPVKQPRPFHAPKPKDRDGIMPFYDEVVEQTRERNMRHG